MQFEKGQLVERISTGERAIAEGVKYEGKKGILVPCSVTTTIRCKKMLVVILWPVDDVRTVVSESKQGPEWILVEHELPAPGKVVWATDEHGNVFTAWHSATVWRRDRTAAPCDKILAWKPNAKPAPYVQPKIVFDCEKCAHRCVCTYLDCRGDIDVDKDCGGKHYFEKMEVCDG